MHIEKLRPGSLPENAVTPEAVYRGRRRFLRNLGFGVAGAATGGGLLRAATGGFPAAQNPEFAGEGLKPTALELITSYNNFYEFGTAKESPKTQANRGWKTEPWTVEITGLVAKPLKIDVNELIRKAGGMFSLGLVTAIGGGTLRSLPISATTLCPSCALRGRWHWFSLRR